MKQLVLIALLAFSSLSFAQKKAKVPKIRNVKSFLLVGKIDKPEDRYAMEVNLTRFLAQMNFRVLPSLNFSKVGNSSELLASDSLNTLLKAKGIDGQLLVTVRGYDKNFRPASNPPETLREALDQGHLFPIFQEQATSISFEFSLYVDQKLSGYELVKVSGISTRQSVFKKLQERLEHVAQKWKNPK